jgi:hypothetical protein
VTNSKGFEEFSYFHVVRVEIKFKLKIIEIMLEVYNMRNVVFHLFIIY